MLKLIFIKNYLIFTGRICSKHFEASELKEPPITHVYSHNTPYQKRLLVNHAIPTLHLSEQSGNESVSKYLEICKDNPVLKGQNQNSAAVAFPQGTNQFILQSTVTKNNDNTVFEKQYQHSGPVNHCQSNLQSTFAQNIDSQDTENQYNLQQAYTYSKKRTKLTDARATYLLYSKTFKEKVKY